MRSNNMKFSFIICVCWSTLLLTASDIPTSFEFPTLINEHLCNDDISLNFSNAIITSIGQNFISSPLISCLSITNTGIQSIEKGAFDELPNLTQLLISNNNINLDQLFSFGSHKNLKILILNSCNNNDLSTIDILEEYPNLEFLSLRTNHIKDLRTLKEETPFPKLQKLDLSNNIIEGTNFVELLPNSLYFLDLHDNSLNSLAFDKKQVNLSTLNLDNNNLKYVKKYNDSSVPHNLQRQYNQQQYDPYNQHYQYDQYNPHNQYNQYNQYDQYNRHNGRLDFYGRENDNPQNFGLAMFGLENLHYLSISQNKIDFIESNAFENTSKLIYLNLSKNNISYLHAETFEKLQSLRLLDLSFNKLEDVPQISSETIISILSLNCNNIKSLSSNAFVQMPKLTKLLLGGNEIAEINVKAFARTSLLEMLDLSKNKLSFLPEEWSESFTTFKYLNLNDNQFTSLESLSLTNALPLIEVHLAMNPLEYLDVSYFKNLPQNLTVNLMQESHFAKHWNSNACESN
ncbi:toll-like receptor 3 [Nylanderia fulva]|uniref:toll-like receptor 3 n=1 Tax=Nylanderia fulva TaxID=613905 RepID=UPI0010FB713A|nr:toll-like receptor 3 [Nylanderia fulva]